MGEIEIEYCVPCGRLDAAVRTARFLLEEFGGAVDRVALRTGHGGVFTVAVDGDVVWDRAAHGDELDLELIAGAVRGRLPAG